MEKSNKITSGVKSTSEEENKMNKNTCKSKRVLMIKYEKIWKGKGKT